MKPILFVAAVAAMLGLAGEATLVVLFASNAIHASYLHGSAADGPSGAAQVFGVLAFLGAFICMGLVVAVATAWDES